MSRDCGVAIPLSAMGLSAVCECDAYYFWVSFMRTAMALATFAWSSLSLRHSLKFSCDDSNGDRMPFCASSEGSGESAHLRRQSLDNVINIKISCAGSKGSWEYARLHRLA